MPLSKRKYSSFQVEIVIAVKGKVLHLESMSPVIVMTYGWERGREKKTCRAEATASEEICEWKFIDWFLKWCKLNSLVLIMVFRSPSLNNFVSYQQSSWHSSRKISWNKCFIQLKEKKQFAAIAFYLFIYFSLIKFFTDRYIHLLRPTFIVFILWMASNKTKW